MGFPISDGGEESIRTPVTPQRASTVRGLLSRGMVVGSLALWVLAVAPVLLRAWREPAHNWDLLPTVALALELQGFSPAEAHRATYQTAARELPQERFAKLTAPGPRQILATQPERFRRVAAFHRGRVTHLAAVSLAHRAGVPLTRSPVLVSILAVAFVLVQSLLWTRSYLGLPLAALGTAFLAQAPVLRILAASSTADALALAVLLLGVRHLLENRRGVQGLALFTLALSIRPDALLFAVAVVAGLYHLRELPARVLVPWLLAGALLHLALRTFAENYGWWALFLYTFVRRTPYPERLPRNFDLGTWWEVLGERLDPGLTGYLGDLHTVGSTHLFVPAGLCVLGLALARSYSPTGLGRHRVVLAALLTETTLRLLLFPSFQDRFFASLHVLTPLVLLSAVARAGRDRLHPLPRRGERSAGRPGGAAAGSPRGRAGGEPRLRRAPAVRGGPGAGNAPAGGAR